MGNELRKIQNYMTENTLTLNKTKSNYFIFRPKRTKKIDITEKMHIDGEVIQKYTTSWFKITKSWICKTNLVFGLKHWFKCKKSWF